MHIEVSWTDTRNEKKKVNVFANYWRPPNPNDDKEVYTREAQIQSEVCEKVERLVRSGDAVIFVGDINQQGYQKFERLS